MTKKTILACFAHPDDELGCVGTLANHAKNGDRVVIAWTTSGEMASFFEGMSFEEVKDIREKQGREIGKIIGSNVETIFLGYGDTEVIPTRENAIKMAKIIAKIKPDAVISWGFNNRHPDHRGTVQLLYDAMTYARIPRITSPDPPHRPPFHIPMFLYYEKISPLRTVYVDISETYPQVEKAFRLYADFYGWSVSDWIHVRRRTDGMDCGVKFAEKFNVFSRYEPYSSLLPINNDA
ncbi:MAG: PIG-L family deacetylase [Candidatus Heimdallarchaeum aukensis]|uniref:PIG-L family deacetylase n=1 Tax=Candidatus Heimdallarchaeum aukensis TaxID=2876573 RepID=A0A9Y1FKI8_9ARCH|nr:MAG: PIG-L family deacetylase [Candidatus Heimdallarchaeum aukensis]